MSRKVSDNDYFAPLTVLLPGRVVRPPIGQKIEAEQAVLSAILIDNSVMNKVAEILKSPDFYRIVHQIIYQIMLDMHAKHQPIDMITLIEELKNRNKLDDVGGVSYITLLANIVPTSANALYHARIVVLAPGCNNPFCRTNLTNFSREKIANNPVYHQLFLYLPR